MNKQEQTSIRQQALCNKKYCSYYLVTKIGSLTPIQEVDESTPKNNEVLSEVNSIEAVGVAEENIAPAVYQGANIIRNQSEDE